VEKIGSYQAKTHLPALLDRVAKGEQFTITRHGVSVAVLTSPSECRKTDVQGTIREILAARKDRRLGGLSVRALIEEGRR